MKYVPETAEILASSGDNLPSATAILVTLLIKSDKLPALVLFSGCYKKHVYPMFK